MSPEWRALIAAQSGYMLDAMDVMLYVFALNTLRDEFSLTNAQAGLVTSLTLIASSIGGIACGILAESFRTRAGSGVDHPFLLFRVTRQSVFNELRDAFFLARIDRAWIGRGVVGRRRVGGGNLVCFIAIESNWVHAVGLGIGLFACRAVISALVLPRFGWRPLFAVGLAPALLALWVRRSVREPEVWRQRPVHRVNMSSIFRTPLLHRTVTASLLVTAVLCGYRGLFTWLPGFLSASKSSGGAGLSLVRTSAFLVPTQIGAFFGYVTFGLVCDRVGRRRTFVVYVLAAACLTVAYGGTRSPEILLALGPLIGFFGSGFFSLFGRLLGELYPVAVRATGQGFTYNLGRALSALAPFLIGSLADSSRSGCGSGGQCRLLRFGRDTHFWIAMAPTACIVAYGWITA